MNWPLLLAVVAAAFTAGRLLPLPVLPGGIEPHKIRLFVGVLSKSTNWERRQAVRETWGADPRLERVVFAVARPQDAETLTKLQDEALHHGDIIFTGHVLESYHNITHQTVDILRAAHAYHAPLTHVLKTDDDSFIQVDNLLQLLRQQPTRLALIGLIRTYKPERRPHTSFTISEEEWPTGTPPPEFAFGAGYVLTKDLVDYMATGTAVQAMPGIVHKFEDSAVGLMLQHLQQQQGLDIRYQQAPEGFLLGRNCQPEFVVAHKMTARQIRCLFESGVGCCEAAKARLLENMTSTA